jgi:hypothetical protein
LQESAAACLKRLKLQLSMKNDRLSNSQSNQEKWGEAAENKEIRTGTHSSLQCTLPNRET